MDVVPDRQVIMFYPELCFMTIQIVLTIRMIVVKLIKMPPRFALKVQQIMPNREVMVKYIVK
ncbi:hypothetical protein HMPREF3091_01940 [Hafnia sp. HMSC23F03]|nr:hypothetical protein HMPREF3091_01940 [Hafnia sp. HMSC23F03]